MNLHHRTPLALTLIFAIFLTSLGLTVSAHAAQPSSTSASDDNDYFLIYQDASGDAICREAIGAERDQIERTRPKNLRQVNHLDMNIMSAEPQTDNDGTHLTIILRATPALEANVAAKAAFLRAAEAWEAVIHSSATIYLDADFTSDGFDSPTILGSTSSPRQTFSYTAVRTALLNGANTPEKQAIYNALPAGSVPIDVSPGTSGNVSVSHSIARSIGLLNPTALETDPKANIKFNSAFSFDFDPSNGITGGTTDFEAVATHEIGHALGFTSRAGDGGTTPAMWDLYRFRSGTTSGTFPTATRIMSIGGIPDPLQFFFAPGQTFSPGSINELGLSTGGPEALTTTGGDGNQSSHWKQQSKNGGVLIGIMDPRISQGVHRTIMPNDTKALDIFGYNSTAAPPPPAPANDNFSAAQAITRCAGTTTGSNVNATRETGEPNHSPDNGGGSRSIWYSWQAPSSGPAQVTTGGSGFDTVLGVYTGGAVGSLSTVGKNDDLTPGQVLTSSVSFTATAGTVYRIAVDGYNNSGSGGDVGPVTVNWAINGCSADWSPATLDGSQVEFKNWTINGETFIYVKLNFPTAGFRVASWGSPVVSGTNSFSVNANVEQFNGGSAQVLTNSAQIYNLGAIAAGSYSFTFQNFNSNVKTHNFTVSFAPPTPNPIDDARTFVFWQYRDFLRRDPDAPGWDHWTGEITECTTDPSKRFPGETEPQCIERKRANTSAAFFLSPEFSNMGYFVLRVYRGTLGRFPHFGGGTTAASEFTRDAATVGANIVQNNALVPSQINANKHAFVDEFVTRAEFQAIYGGLTPAQFVDKLRETTGVPLADADRTALINEITANPANKSSVVFKVVDGTNTITDGALQFQTTYGKAFYDSQFNAAFVYMEYLGYLQRDPDDGGFNFWLGKLNQFGNWVDAQMVLAFIKSPEYRSRFGSP